jgi:hypothetical protein
MKYFLIVSAIYSPFDNFYVINIRVLVITVINILYTDKIIRIE